MSVSPAISVVIPCYNSASSLERTLASARAQTMDDVEIIVVDDGSTDNTVEIARRIAAADGRVVVLSQANAGVSAARNLGISSARADIIALLDSDDLWDVDHLAIHLARMRSDGALGVSFSPVRFIEADGSATGERTHPKLVDLTPAEILSTNPCSTCSTMVIRAGVFADVGMFRETLRRAEDQEWLFRVSLSRWKIEGVDRILVSYRNSPDGLSANLEAMYEGFRDMLGAARQSAPALVDRLGPLAAARMSRYLARRALRLRLDRGVARGFISRGLRMAPAMLMSEPRQTIATALAATIPGLDTLLFRVFKRA
jgi:glycosyltransferase involved in cell wall biosynthesis